MTARRENQLTGDAIVQSRARIFWFVILGAFLLIILRLFYWQVVRGNNLQAEAEEQYERSLTKSGSRGIILTADGHPLVTNQQVYRAFAQPQTLTQEPSQVAKLLAPELIKDYLPYIQASASAEKEEIITEFTEGIEEKLNKPNSKWVSLATNISEVTRQAVLDLNIHGIGFDPYEVRAYPEASMAAQLTGFVGKNDQGEDTGYFGVEGGLDQELKGRYLRTTVLTDALGQQLTTEQRNHINNLNGRDVHLTIQRDLQYLAETQLHKGIQKYGAESGEIIIMEPSTGKLLALAAAPKFDQQRFFQYDPELYSNPSLSKTYEPGSTFKLLTVAAGLDAGVISPSTQCDRCSGPRVFGQYTIRTWNDQYTPNITMTEALAKSDNTAMIFIAEKVGADKLKQYLKNFGIGESLHIDLQGDLDTPFPQRWGPVELATISFGQGISTTSLQLLRAVAAIANDGVMMRPMVVEQVTDPASGESIVTEPIIERQVIETKTAETLTQMMVEAAQHGEAQWTASKTHRVAGKTGTSQVAQAGEYAEDQTIASFIGFAPPENPKFIMLVKLENPSSSIWAAETAAPLWYETARDVYLYLNIPPDRSTDTEE